MRGRDSILLLLWLVSGCVSGRDQPLSPPPLAAQDFTAWTPPSPAITEPALFPDLPDASSRPEASGPARLIDLAEALELAGANSLQVAIAREELEEAQGRLDEANVLWLPTLHAGAIYTKHEGRLQETEGSILQVSRNAGFVGGGVVASFGLADALLTPDVAQHEADAARASVTSTINDTYLEVALTYLELLAAQARQALAEDNLRLAEELVELAEAFASAGQGLESDAARARSEASHRERVLAASNEAIASYSVRLATLLRLDPTVRLRASEPRLAPIVLVPEDLEVQGLIHRALASRPELRAASELLQADEERERQETLRPLLPELVLGARGGGLGGGTGSDFNRFSESGDFSVGLVWSLRSLGFGERSVRRQRDAQRRQAELRVTLTRDRVAQEVSVAHLETEERRRQIEFAARNVEQALLSLDLNMRRIRGAEGLPIESLQAIQAAAVARDTYLEAVRGFNQAQFRLLRAVGHDPTL